MDIQEVKEVFSLLDSSLNPRQKKYIHFRSMQNFLYHYDNLPSNKIKEQICILFAEYIDDIQSNSYNYKGPDSYLLASKFLDKMSESYTHYLGFKSFLRIKYVIVFSILGDGLIYFFIRDHIRVYFPVVTLILLTYYVYTTIAFGRKKKIFGIFY